MIEIASPDSELAQIQYIKPLGTDRARLPVAALESEGSLATVSLVDQRVRRQMIEELRVIPREALLNLRHFQAQIGCLNRCSFCSQSAGTTMWHLSRSALANLVAALKTVAIEHALEDGRVSGQPLSMCGTFHDTFKMPEFGLIASKRNDRPGVIYCYLDNDPSAYPYLDDMIEWLHTDLGIKIRIATVGYSRQNAGMQQMHSRISRDLMSSVAGFRLSFSPYTYGWTSQAERANTATRHDFEMDTANLLDTYRETFLSDRNGRKGACIELRFRPLVVPALVEAQEVGGHAVIRAGPYLVVSMAPTSFPPIATICDPHSHANQLSEQGYPAWMIYAHEQKLNATWREIVQTVTDGRPFHSSIEFRAVHLHTLANDDGQYFAVDAERQPTGYYSKYFYPKTLGRPSSGYIDGERYFLNELIGAKQAGKCSTWYDANSIIERLHAKARKIEPIDAGAAQYIEGQVIAVVSSYIKVLRYADYPALAFFDRRTTVDTGHICNLGRAYHEYKSIASRPDLPLTPNHERSFGTSGELAQEGITWRLSVAPMDDGFATAGACGARNSYRNGPSILIEELDLSMTATEAGQSRKQYFIQTQDIARISLKDTRIFPIIPGHKLQGGTHVCKEN